MSPDVEAAIGVIAEAIAERVAARLLAGERPGWIDQAASPLGRRRHCAAVRRRVAAGEPGAAILGRRHVLTAEALGEEMRVGKPKAKPTGTQDVRAELERELRLVGSGSR